MFNMHSALALCLCLCLCIYVHRHVCIHEYMYVNAYECMYVRILAHVCTHVWIYACQMPSFARGQANWVSWVYIKIYRYAYTTHGYMTIYDNILTMRCFEYIYIYIYVYMIWCYVVNIECSYPNYLWIQTSRLPSQVPHGRRFFRSLVFCSCLGSLGCFGCGRGTAGTPVASCGINLLASGSSIQKTMERSTCFLIGKSTISTGAIWNIANCKCLPQGIWGWFIPP